MIDVQNVITILNKLNKKYEYISNEKEITQPN